MKKTLIVIALLIGIAITGCNTATDSDTDSISSDEKLTLKLANGEAVGADRDLSIQEFKKLVEEKSNGQIEIEVYSGGVLGSWRDTIEGLEPGIVQIVVESIGTLESYSTTAAIDAFPFLYKSIEDYEKIMFGEMGQQIMDKVGKEGGFKLLAPSYRGARNVTATKKIESLGDLQGFKLRAPGLDMYLKTWEGLGASPIPMDISEVYTGIQQGTVNGQENPLAVSYANAFYEVCPYLIMTNHVISSDVYIFNDEYYENLSDSQKSILNEAAQEASSFRTDLVKKNEDEYIKQFEVKEVEVIYPDTSAFADKLNGLEKEFPAIEDLVAEIKGLQ